MVTGVAGTVYVVVTKTPLKAKLSELVFGPPLEDEEPEPITLPVTESPAPAPAAETVESGGRAGGDQAHRTQGQGGSLDGGEPGRRRRLLT